MDLQHHLNFEAFPEKAGAQHLSPLFLILFSVGPQVIQTRICTIELKSEAPVVFKLVIVLGY